MKRVTAAVIIEDGRLLLARRATGDPLEGLWELPGGKIEADETPQACLERELQEELGMRSEAGEVIATTEYHYAHGSFEMLAMATRRLSDYAPIVHSEIAWVAPADLSKYPLAPADIDLVAKLRASSVW